LLVIEDKKDYEKHVRFDEKNLISLDLSNGDVKDFAMNGALHYAKHLAEKTNYKKILAI
jgi:site-specific DNA-methyltransferase